MNEEARPRDSRQGAYMYGVLIQQEREKISLSRHRLADLSGTSSKVVRLWESGKAMPTADQIARMEAKLPKLKQYRHLAKPPKDRPVRFPAIEAAEHLAQSNPQPAPEPQTEMPKKRFHKKPLKKPIEQYPTFGAALRAARLAEGMKGDDLAKLMGLSGSGTISHWEMGRTTPVRENYDKLIQLLPILERGPKPESVKTKSVPKGNRTPGHHPPIGSNRGPRTPPWEQPVTTPLGPALQAAVAASEPPKASVPPEPPTPPVAADKPPPAPDPIKPDESGSLRAVAAQVYAQAQEALDATTKELRDIEIRVDMLTRKLTKLRESHATLTKDRDKALDELKDLL